MKMFAYTPGFNPQRRYAPKPRPDFAVMNGVKVVRLLDAKYRDLWETKLQKIKSIILRQVINTQKFCYSLYINSIRLSLENRFPLLEN